MRQLRQVKVLVERKTSATIKFLLAASIVLSSYAGLTEAVAEEKSLLGKVGSTISDTAHAVSDTVTGTVDSVLNPKEAAKARREIDEQTKKGLNLLLNKSPAARALYEKSYGYAVFDSRKWSFMFATGSGAGVAVEKPSQKRTYMKMFTGGVNLGAGVQYFKVVFLFENRAAFNRFVNSGWEAGAEASASFGKDALAANARFVQGMAVFQLNETGIMANMNITGTKYWRSQDLNSKA